MDLDKKKWLVMPTSAIEPKILQAENDFGLPNGFTEHLFQRLEKGNQTAVSIVGDNWIYMDTAPDKSKAGHKVNDSEMDAYVSNILGIAIGKPLKSTNDLIADGWEI